MSAERLTEVINKVEEIGSSAIDGKYVTSRGCSTCLNRGDYRCYD